MNTRETPEFPQRRPGASAAFQIAAHIILRLHGCIELIEVGLGGVERPWRCWGYRQGAALRGGEKSVCNPATQLSIKCVTPSV